MTSSRKTQFTTQNFLLLGQKRQGPVHRLTSLHRSRAQTTHCPVHVLLSLQTSVMRDLVLSASSVLASVSRQQGIFSTLRVHPRSLWGSSSLRGPSLVHRNLMQLPSPSLRWKQAHVSLNSPVSLALPLPATPPAPAGTLTCQPPCALLTVWGSGVPAYRTQGYLLLPASPPRSPGWLSSLPLQVLPVL